MHGPKTHTEREEECGIMTERDFFFAFFAINGFSASFLLNDD
jgi:hypothetical protein